VRQDRTAIADAQIRYTVTELENLRGELVTENLREILRRYK
jgi:hypothetical protein